MEFFNFFLCLSETDKNNILAAFSVYNNGEKLFKTTTSSSANVMECVNGIRVLSIVWVIYSHSYVIFILAPTKNLAVMGEVRKIVKFYSEFGYPVFVY